MPDEKLSPLRDAHALIEVFDELKRDYREQLADGSVLGVRDGFDREQRAAGT